MQRRCIRVKGWPVAAGVSGVVREFARSLNSEDVFALCSLTVCPTGPISRLERELGLLLSDGMLGNVSSLQLRMAESFDVLTSPLTTVSLTFWVAGWS
jgi:hypothetical protein